MTDHIYTLINEYDQLIDTESSASINACVILSKYQSALLADCGGKHTEEYDKRISEFREKRNIKKSQFNKDVKVGKYVIAALSQRLNEPLPKTKNAIYTQHCIKTKAPSKDKTTKPKIDYKKISEELQYKYEQQSDILEYIKSKMGEETWNKFLAKYHNK